jgi:hypothetical protein
LKVNLRATDLPEPSLGFDHHGTPKAQPATVGGHGNKMDPAAVSVKSGHHRADDPAVKVTDEE